MSNVAANRVLINTGIMYGKMVLTVGITFYTTRVVLNALGETDFGIYNLIAGVVAMLSFLNAAMTISTQRYLSFHQGDRDVNKRKVIFANSLLLHLCIGVFLVLFIEGIGFYLFDHVLNIPNDRVDAAIAIYHFMAITLFFSVIAVPFVASINAHESMLWIAIVNIIEVLLKLGIALLLYHKCIHLDNLIFYGVSMAFISGISFTLYTSFSLKKFEECSLNFFNRIDKVLVRELGAFAGWNLFGALCGLGRIQGTAVILNVFLGTVVNAAYGIANQVASQLNFFSATMLRVINPQIMKSEGMGDRKRMLRLSLTASKFGFLLFAFFSIPTIFEMEGILNIWLKQTPEYTVIFCQLFLVGIMTNQLTIGLQSAIQATGRIKEYQAIVGTVILLNLPISYILLKFGFPAYSVFITYIALEVMACILRLFFLKQITNFPITDYTRSVLSKLIIPVIFTTLVCVVIVSLMNPSISRIGVTMITSSIVFILSVYFTSLNAWEKEFANEKLRKFKR